MIACVVCHGDTALDDVARGVDVGFDGPVRWWVCLRCHDRHAGKRRPVPSGLRLEVAAALAEADRPPRRPSGR